MKTLRLCTTLLLLLSACGDDDGPNPGADAAGVDAATADAGATDSGATDSGATDSGATDSAVAMCPDLQPISPPELIISKIDLAARQVELFNPGDTDVVIGDHAWCVRPAYPEVASTGPTMVPAGQYAIYTLPPAVTLDSAGGELALYRSGPFGNPANMMDYVCWGTGKSGPNRASEADRGGWWMGDCASAPTDGAIVRLPDTDGTSAASYDTTATFTPTTCE